MIWFVSRHPGALAWAQTQGLAWHRAVTHIDPADVSAGDDVYGVLPAHIAATLCSRGVRYWHLATEVPESLRGCEMSAEAMAAHGARFVRLHVQEVAA